MKANPAIHRILLLLTGLLAAYQIVIGVEGASPMTVGAHTIAFGVLLLAGLLLIIFGLEALDSPYVVVVATIIPLSLSLGLVWEFAASWRSAYLAFVLTGFIAVVLTRLPCLGDLATFTLAGVHGVAGLIIFILPIGISFQEIVPWGFALVGVGGGLIGVGGLLLLFLIAGKPVLSREMILLILPGILLLMTAAFVAGFSFV